MKKRILMFVAVVLMIFIYTGCSSKEPNSGLLKEDLSTNLKSYYSYLVMDEYEIVQSMTEDKSYTATVSVTADSEYARFYLTAAVDYSKYDQGWGLNYCEWTVDNYEVVRWPSEDEMDVFLEERVSRVEDYMQYPEYTTLSNDGYTTLIYEGTIASEYEDYVGFQGTVISYWTYNATEDTFDFSEDLSDVKLTLTHNIEGTWLDERMSIMRNYYFIITEQKEDSFTIEYTYDDLKETVYLATSIEDFKESKRLTFYNDSTDYDTRVELYGSVENGYCLQHYTNYDGSNYSFNKYANIE